MNTTARKFTSLTLALIMTGLALASCSDSGNTPAQTQDTASADTTTAETTTAELMPDLPDKDFEGAEFLMFTSGEKDANGADWITYDVYAEAENGDPINDAVYARNMYLSETYNVKISEKKSETTTLADGQKVILAGEDVYDAIMTNFQYGSTFGQNSQVYDLYEIPYIDFDAPWWDGELAENLSVAGRMHYATGDITVMDNDAIWVMMFNKQMMKDYGLEGIYEEVLNGEWYFDNFTEKSKSVASDLNGDGAMAWQDDRFAFMTGPQSGLSAIYGSGIKFVSKDSDDLPVYSLDMDRASTVAEAYGKLFTSKEILVSDSSTIMPIDIRTAFEEGRVLFFGEVLQCIQRMRASETDFGLIPWPKFDENQENYAHIAIPSAAKCITIPVTQADTEFAGFILEAMAAKSKYTLTPAYYEVALTEKYMRDEESVGMLEIILDTLNFDLAYSNAWGSLTANVQTSVRTGASTFASTIDSTLPAFESAMQKTVETYLSAN